MALNKWAVVFVVMGLVSVTQADVLRPVASSRVGKLPPMHLPFAGNGTCGKPVHDNEAGTTTVQCLGPKHLLSPGQTINTMMLLETPYPKDRSVVLLNITSEMVDDNLAPVPLSDLYVHHYGSPLILGSGAELRGTFKRKALPAPYVMIINGTALSNPLSRMSNIQLINTVGLPEGQGKPCLECWCDHDPWHPDDVTRSPVHSLSDMPQHKPPQDKGDPTWNDTRPGSLAGSLFCCSQCPTNQPIGGPYGYHLQYTVTYRDIKPDEHIKQVDFLGLDVMGGNFEYQLTEAMGPGSIHTKSLDTTIDRSCPQKNDLTIVRCQGHQHFGSQCLTLIDLDADKTICTTCAEFGTEKGVPGNEEGYVVRIPDDDLALDGRAYTVKPGTRVRIESKYDASVPRFGIMGLFALYVDGMDHTCTGFGGDDTNMVRTSMNNEEYTVPLYGMLGLPTPYTTPLQAS